jgi:hypothetical protein
VVRTSVRLKMMSNAATATRIRELFTCIHSSAINRLLQAWQYGTPFTGRTFSGRSRQPQSAQRAFSLVGNRPGIRLTKMTLKNAALRSRPA